MRKQETLDHIEHLGLLAVLRGPSEQIAIKMVEALVAGGVQAIEVTYSTPSAAAVVRKLNERYGVQILLCLGALTEPAQAPDVQAAGARFVASLHTDPELAPVMAATGLPFLMGGIAPNEVQFSHKLGRATIKLFPGSLGGPDYLRALKGSFPTIKIVPTGGVNKDNLCAWFAARAFAVGAGGELCPMAWDMEGRFDDITQRTHEFVLAVQSAQVL